MAALFEPFPLWLSLWETPSLGAVPMVSVHKGRVVHTSKTAKQLGITTGSSLATALTKAPDLEVVEAASPYLAASWERIAEELSGLRGGPYPPDSIPLVLNSIHEQGLGVTARPGTFGSDRSGLLVA